jgi:hypothetical protein
MTHTDEVVAELRKKLLNELELDCDHYDPDQGMPEVVWHLNDAQIDYIIATAQSAKVTEFIQLLDRYEIFTTGEDSYAIGQVSKKHVLDALSHTPAEVTRDKK